MAVTAKMVNYVDIEVFSATVNALKADPQKGATVWTAKTKWWRITRQDKRAKTGET